MGSAKDKSDYGKYISGLSDSGEPLKILCGWWGFPGILVAQTFFHILIWHSWLKNFFLYDQYLVKTPYRDFLQLFPHGVRNSKFLEIMPGHKGLIIIILHCMATIQPVTAHTHKIALLYFMHKVCQESRGPVRDRMQIFWSF